MPENESSNYCIIVLISHASKVTLKILQARLHQYMNQECSNVQAGFRKSRGKVRECQKNIYSCFIDYAKALDCVDYNKLENS